MDELEVVGKRLHYLSGGLEPETQFGESSRVIEN